MSTSIHTLHDRLKLLISNMTSEARRFRELEEQTGITSATWKTYWFRGTRPSADLIQAAAMIWPEHAFWLVTGIDDSGFGHSSPVNTGFPREAKPQTSGSVYFKAAIAKGVEAEEEIREWADEETQNLSSELKDRLKRNARQLKGRNDVTSIEVLLNAAEKLRKAEILLDNYVSMLGYDDTERIYKVASMLLDSARSLAKENGLEWEDKPVQNKLLEIKEQLDRHKRWAAEHEHKHQQS